MMAAPRPGKAEVAKGCKATRGVETHEAARPRGRRNDRGTEAEYGFHVSRR